MASLSKTGGDMNYYKPSTELQREAEQVITNIIRLSSYRKKRQRRKEYLEFLELRKSRATQELVQYGLNNEPNWTIHDLTKAMERAHQAVDRGETFANAMNIAIGPMVAS